MKDQTTETVNQQKQEVITKQKNKEGVEYNRHKKEELKHLMNRLQNKMI